MKFPLNWHRECLSNRRRSLAEQIRRHEQEASRIEQSTAEVEFYQEQINAASAKKLDGFDREKFMKKRRAHQDRADLKPRTTNAE